MKVYPFSPSENIHEYNCELNYWKLSFTSHQTEEKFSHFLQTSEATVARKLKFKTFKVLQQIVIMIYLASYLLLLKENSMNKSLIFQISMILSIFVFAVVSF